MPSCRERVLLVDSNPDVLDVFVKLLRKIGFEAIPATKGSEALAIFMKESFHGAIIEYRLEDMTGVELARKLKEIRSDVRILLLTADPTLEELLAEAEGLPIMAKPASMNEIRYVLEELLPDEQIQLEE